jgi:hypothetical protein
MYHDLKNLNASTPQGVSTIHSWAGAARPRVQELLHRRDVRKDRSRD